MMAKPMKTLELPYPMIQFLIISDIPQFLLGIFGHVTRLDQSRAKKIDGFITNVIIKITISSLVIGLKKVLFSTNSLAKLLSDSLLLDSLLLDSLLSES